MKKITLLAGTVILTVGALAGCGANGSSKDIGRDAALETALSDAQTIEADVTRLKVSEDRDDGRKVYEISFDVNGMEYDYEVAASDGQILSAEREELVSSGAGNTADSNAGSNAGQTTDGSAQGSSENNANHEDHMNYTDNPNVKLTREEAMKIALERVSGASEKDIHIELDSDDGQFRYEGDIIYEQKEYDFEIDANSGNILEWSEERR